LSELRGSAMSAANLRLDWCDHQAAKYAVEKWHYSGRMPVGPMVKIGAWENDDFIGAVLFGRGANNSIGRPYGLRQTEVCELVRIALRAHVTAVSRIVSISLQLLKQHCGGIRLVISYADDRQGHIGVIYQAGNWLYVGRAMSSTEFFHDGRWKHNREITSGAFGKRRRLTDYSGLPRRLVPGKHKYLMPLDLDMRRQVAVLFKPYPKRATSIDVDAPADQAGEGGSIPTVALH
jgi:hypothetical protein